MNTEKIETEKPQTVIESQLESQPEFPLGSIEQLFQEGLERYKAGESAADLIPTYQKICDRQPKVASGWICLSWLYLLDKKSAPALKAAKTAVKLSPEDPQAHINLALALMENSQPGVRAEVEAAQNWLMIMSDLKPEIEGNFEEAKKRRPDWQNLTKVEKWIFS
jgi:cytochrome c-type biogenesis protein CcmH/NrfG